MLVAELFFGRGVKGRAPVSDAEWAEFAAQTVTPNFPGGFTVFDGEGQWRKPANRPNRQRSDQDSDGRGRANTRSRATAVGSDRRLPAAVPPTIGRHHHP